MKAIYSFQGKYDFISNFYLGEGSAVVIDGILYETTEHAFQAGKFVKRSIRRQVAGCSSPGNSKRFARALAAKVGNRAGWKSLDISIYWMLKVIRLKFQHPLMRHKLLSTEDAELWEGNIWGDDFWGVVRNTNGDWEGQNWLGRILMHVREELRTGKQTAFKPDRYR